MTTLVQWNVNKRQLWEEIASVGADVALLQEVARVDDCPYDCVPEMAEGWHVGGWESRPFRTAVMRVSDNVTLGDPIPFGTIDTHDRNALPISRSGTLAAARVNTAMGNTFVAVSAYAAWERYFGADKPVWSDGSAHRILSDLAPLLWHQAKTPLVVAGDWNILRGYGEHGDPQAKRRYDNFFERAEALDLVFIGPEYPHGRKADPVPDELPDGSLCVPTYYRPGKNAATATRQLDFVFASKSIANRVTARAMNGVDEWGPSDHCRTIIEVDF